MVSNGRIWVAAGVLLALAVAAAFALGETASDIAVLAARYTARVSFLLFVVVVSAGPAARRWKGGVWTQLARHRRHLGLAFAALMAAHFVALAINVGFYNPRSLTEMLAGGVIYLFIAALALTSNNLSQRRMGKWWRRLHWWGVLVILGTFAQAYVGRLFEPDYFWTGMVFAPVAVSALVLRIVIALRR